MFPDFTVQYFEDGRSVDLEFRGECYGPLPSGVAPADIQDDFCGQLAEGMSLASWARFRMQSRAAAVSACQSFGMQARPVSVSPRKFFRTRTRRIAVTSGARLRMRAGSALRSSCSSPFQVSITKVGDVGTEPQVAASLVQDVVHLVGADIVIADTGSNIAGVPDDLTNCRPFFSRKPPCVNVGVGPSLVFRAKAAVPITIAFGGPKPASVGNLDPRPQPITTGWIGILAGHRLTPSGGVTPPAIASSAGALVRPNYTRSLRVEAA